MFMKWWVAADAIYSPRAAELLLAVSHSQAGVFQLPSLAMAGDKGAHKTLNSAVSH